MVDELKMLYQFRDRVDGNYVVNHPVGSVNRPESRVVLRIGRDELINFVSVKAYVAISRLILRIFNEEDDESKGKELASFVGIEKGITTFFVPKVEQVRLYRARIVIDNLEEIPETLLQFTFGIIQI